MKVRAGGRLGILTRHNVVANRQQENYLFCLEALYGQNSAAEFRHESFERQLKEFGFRGIRVLQSSAEIKDGAHDRLTRELTDFAKQHIDQAERIEMLLNRISREGIQPTGFNFVYGIAGRESKVVESSDRKIAGVQRNSDTAICLDKLIDDLRECAIEEIHAVYLDNDHSIRQVVCLSRGAVSSAKLDIGSALKPAVVHEYKKIILVHNHPSGSCKPSVEDIHFSRAFSNAAAALGITLVNHIIVGADETASAL